MSVEEEPTVAAPTITIPANNANVRNGEIDVSGTTSSQGLIIARLYTQSGSAAIAQGQGVQTGSLWTARLPGAFAPGQYRIEVAQGETRRIHVTLRVTPVVITRPSSGDAITSPFTISGTGGEYLVGAVSVHNAIGNAQIGTGVIRANGDWTAAVELPSDAQSLTLYAKQKIGPHFSPNSNSITVSHLPQVPQISSPAADSLQAPTFEVQGTLGVVGAVVIVEDSAGKEVGRSTALTTAGSWTCSVTVPSGRAVLRAKQIRGGHTSLPSSSRAFRIRPPEPVILGPAANSNQPTTFNLTGNMGMIGATLVVMNDGGSTEVGRTAALTGANWQCSVTVAVGLVTLVAKQLLGEESLGSVGRPYKVAPPALTKVDMLYPAPNSVKFSGVGHNGALVEIRIVSGPSGAIVPPAKEVKGGVWEMTATGWPLGTYQLSAFQKISIPGNAWIESPHFAFTSTIAVPDPTDIKYTVADYTPTFSGRGVTGATILIKKQGGAEAAPDATVRDSQWTSKSAQVWGPMLSQNVDLKQQINGQSSANWIRLIVTIAPLAPVITAVTQNGLSPDITGTCWPGAVVDLVYSDSPVVHKPVQTNGNWAFRRTAPFAYGVRHTVTVTQLAGGQQSPSASSTFDVQPQVPTPLITEPLSESQVGRDLKVKGTQGMAGATMQLRDAARDVPLGAPLNLLSAGDWEIELKGLEFRAYTIDAQQTFQTYPSLRSEYRGFTVALMPPLFTVPTPEADLPRTATLSGTGIANGRIFVWLDGERDFLLEDVVIGFDGRWQGQITLPVGVTTLRARQTFVDANGKLQTSSDSPALVFNIVPAAPFIETPVKNEHVGYNTVVSGFGYPGDRVTVSLTDATRTVLGTATVLEDRSWSVKSTFDQPGDRYDLVAVASSGGFDSARSAAVSVNLGRYLPTIATPTAGQWVSEPLTFAGLGRAGTGQLVSWYNPEHVWAANLPVTGTGWRVVPTQPLPAGANWCRFKQTISDGSDRSTASDWVESERFELIKPASQ